MPTDGILPTRTAKILTHIFTLISQDIYLSPDPQCFWPRFDCPGLSENSNMKKKKKKEKGTMCPIV